MIRFLSEEFVTADEEDRKRPESFSFEESERGESVVFSEGDEESGLSLIGPKISLA
jgi:hypothetical protein